VRLHALPFAAAVLLAGCSPAGTFTIPTGGTTLELPGGASLSVPAGAVDEDVEVTATLLTDLADAGYAPEPDFVGTLRLSLALEPHGLQFNEPVVLGMPHGGLADGLSILRADDEDDERWESAGLLEIDGDLARLRIDSFSGYTLTEVRDGACPCYDPADLLDYRARAAVAGWVKDAAEGPDVRRMTYWDGVTSVTVSAAGSTLGGTTYRSCGAYAAGDWGSPIQGVLPDWMPGIPETDFGTGTGNSMRDITETQVRACLSLSETIFEGAPGGGLEVEATGIGGGGVALESGTVRWNIAEGSNLKLYPLGDEVTLTVSATVGLTCVLAGNGATIGGGGATATLTPSGVRAELTLTCTSGGVEACNGLDDDGDGSVDEDFDQDGDGVTTCGPDGTAGNADDDCDDADANVNPSADEVCDNGVDDDCDGASIDGETADGDADGVPDDCDTNPGAPCATVTLAQAEALLAEAGAACFVDTTGANMPAVLQGDADSFTGVFVQWTPDAWEIAGAGRTDPAWFVGYGCSDATTTYCADNSRPLLPADSVVTEAAHDACYDVLAYACR